MSPPDCELIQRIVQNDRQAFDQLFYRYQTAIFQFAFYLTQNKNEAEELFQETWLRVVKYLPEQSSLENFKAWLFRITVNLHRDQLRKKRIRRLFSVSPTQTGTPDDSAATASEPLVNDDSIRVEIGVVLEQALAGLPLKQRRVFMLKEVEGFKHHEISEILAIPVGTVKSLLHRAIKRLQTELAEFHDSG